MLRSMKIKLACRCRRRRIRADRLGRAGAGAIGRADQDRLRHGADRPAAANGKQALLGMKIWEEEINAKGGLLGRPVKLVYYDDQSNPSTVPGIYTKLLDVDKVDLVVGGYATNMVAPAMPVVMQKNKMFISPVRARRERRVQVSEILLGAADRPDAEDRRSPRASSRSRLAQNPKPTTVALAAEDAEFSRNACEGARENAKKFGLKIVYDKTYPPSTTDFTPIVRALQAANADLVVDLLLSARARSAWCKAVERARTTSRR